MINLNEVTPLSKWLAIFLFILVLPVLSFNIGKQYEQATNLNIENHVSLTTSNIKPANQGATKIDTSTWKTYRNDIWKFEFKYPPEAKINTFGAPAYVPDGINLAVESLPKINPNTVPTFLRLGIINEGEAFKSGDGRRCSIGEGEKINLNGVEYYTSSAFMYGVLVGSETPHYSRDFITQKTKTGFSNYCIIANIEAWWSDDNEKHTVFHKDVTQYDSNFNPEIETQIGIEILKSLKFDN